MIKGDTVKLKRAIGAYKAGTRAIVEDFHLGGEKVCVNIPLTKKHDQCKMILDIDDVRPLYKSEAKIKSKLVRWSHNKYPEPYKDTDL